MSIRKNKSLTLAAAKAGISERSARRIDVVAVLPSQNPRRYWSSRVDPFADVWDGEVVPLLKSAPTFMAVTLLRKLQDDHPGRFPDGMLRTLQRHLRKWRALQGPAREVFFPQEHAPGRQGLSDFTSVGELRMTIADRPFAHIPYHFVLAFSRWEHVEVVEGGESFEALSKGLQNALWQAGGAPEEHRSDSLSAAFKNLSEQEDFTARYSGLLEHYGMVGTRNNRGLGHENGSVESSHRHLKEAIEQALLPGTATSTTELAMRRSCARRSCGATGATPPPSASSASSCRISRSDAPPTSSRRKRASRAAVRSPCGASSTARRRARSGIG